MVFNEEELHMTFYQLIDMCSLEINYANTLAVGSILLELLH